MMDSRKGFMFSIFVITALSLIVLTFKIQSEFKEENRAEIFEERVSKTNLFIEDMEKDIERSLYVSSFRAFIGLDEYIQRNEEYVSNVEGALVELILNGTIDEVQMNSTNSSTFMNWAEKIRLLGERYRIDLSFEDLSVEVEQKTPWIIEIDLSANLSVSDFDNIIGWNFSIYQETEIDIKKANLPDPIYFVESINNYEKNTGNALDEHPLLNNIAENPYNSFWQNISEEVNADNLRMYTINQLYNKSETGPSYLMRLKGELNCSKPEYVYECKKYGIESFVNVENTTNKNIWYFSNEGKETCAVDYQFFSMGCDAEDMHLIINMSDNFFLDENYLKKYNLTKINRT